MLREWLCRSLQWGGLRKPQAGQEVGEIWLGIPFPPRAPGLGLRASGFTWLSSVWASPAVRIPASQVGQCALGLPGAEPVPESRLQKTEFFLPGRQPPGRRKSSVTSSRAYTDARPSPGRGERSGRPGPVLAHRDAGPGPSPSDPGASVTPFGSALGSSEGCAGETPRQCSKARLGRSFSTCE